jgi:hypothetical protein
MIADLDTSYCSATHNGKPALANTSKAPERTGWEMLAWAVLEQAVDDLAVFARWGIISPTGKCLPWPTQMKRRVKVGRKGQLEAFYSRVPRTIASSHGPHDHRQLRAWFLSDEAQQFCDWIGCRLPAREIFAATVKNHGGLGK